MINKKNFPGMDGFVWFTGIVEERRDPLKLGRVQLRIFGWHTENKQLIPTEELLWAQPVLSANNYDKTSVPKEGEVVLGFFIDGESGQFPFYFGVLPNIPEKIYPKEKGFSDPGEETSMAERPIPQHIGEPTRYPPEMDLNEPTTSRTARHENLEKTPMLKAIIPPVANTVYPYNHSTQTESGHIFDMDDTRFWEQILLMHRLASYIQLGPFGEITITSPTSVTITAPVVVTSGY